MCATVVSTLAATGPEPSSRPDDRQRPATMHLLRAPGSPPGQPTKPHTDASTVTASHTTPRSTKLRAARKRPPHLRRQHHRDRHRLLPPRANPRQSRARHQLTTGPGALCRQVDSRVSSGPASVPVLTAATAGCTQQPARPRRGRAVGRPRFCPAIPAGWNRIKLSGWCRTPEPRWRIFRWGGCPAGPGST